MSVHTSWIVRLIPCLAFIALLGSAAPVLAAPPECELICTVASSCTQTCMDGGRRTTCGAWGLCTTPECGNGTCDQGETPLNCGQDCQPPVCGDGVCASSGGDCEGDCIEAAGFCGDGRCQRQLGETDEGCPRDCPQCSSWGCDGREGWITECNRDLLCAPAEAMPVSQVCGDGKCRGAEPITCPSDCIDMSPCIPGRPAPPADCSVMCGDVYDCREIVSCPPCRGVCGDRICDFGENCPADCLPGGDTANYVCEATVLDGYDRPMSGVLVQFIAFGRTVGQTNQVTEIERESGYTNKQGRVNIRLTLFPQPSGPPSLSYLECRTPNRVGEVTYVRKGDLNGPPDSVPQDEPVVFNARLVPEPTDVVAVTGLKGAASAKARLYKSDGYDNVIVIAEGFDPGEKTPRRVNRDTFWLAFGQLLKSFYRAKWDVWLVEASSTSQNIHEQAAEYAQAVKVAANYRPEVTPKVALFGFSMGGLVLRIATARWQADPAWREALDLPETIPAGLLIFGDAPLRGAQANVPLQQRAWSSGRQSEVNLSSCAAQQLLREVGFGGNATGRTTANFEAFFQSGQRVWFPRTSPDPWCEKQGADRSEGPLCICDAGPAVFTINGDGFAHGLRKVALSQGTWDDPNKCYGDDRDRNSRGEDICPHDPGGSGPYVPQVGDVMVKIGTEPYCPDFEFLAEHRDLEPGSRYDTIFNARERITDPPWYSFGGCQFADFRQNFAGTFIPIRSAMASDDRYDTPFDAVIVNTFQATHTRVIQSLAEQLGKELGVFFRTGLSGAPLADVRHDALSTPSGREFSIEAYHSRDHNTGIAQYVYDFGDGTHATTTEPGVSHEFERPGVYSVRLKVVDHEGLIDTSDTRVVVGSLNPDPRPGGPYVGWVDSPVQFDGTASLDFDDDIRNHFWRFGDGGKDSGETAEHAYAARGTYPVALSATDVTGKTVTAWTSAVIAGGNRPPRLAYDGVEGAPGITQNGALVSGCLNQGVRLKMTRTDPDGDPMTNEWVWNDSTTGCQFSHTEAFCHIRAVPDNQDVVVKVIVRDNQGGQSELVWALSHTSNNWIGVGDVTVTEGSGGPTELAFPVTLSNAVGHAVSVDFTTAAGGSAALGADYAARTVRVTIPAHHTSVLVPVSVVGDLLDEGVETVKVALSNPAGALLGDDGAVGTIHDDDPTPYVTVGSPSAQEDGLVPTSLAFPVTLSSPTSLEVALDFTTTAEGSATPGVDFHRRTLRVTIAPGETAATVPVAVIGDPLDEDDETVGALISNVSGANLGQDHGAGVILDDDPTPSFMVEDPAVEEGDAGLREATFRLRLSAPSGRAVSVRYQTADGTATANADYTPTGGQANLAAGQTETSIGVPVIGDTTWEPDEAFRLALTEPENVLLASPARQGSIVNDDLPSLSVNDAGFAEGPSAASRQITVSLVAPSDVEVTVKYESADCSATTKDYDYSPLSGTLTFAPGQTTKSISVGAVGDPTFEGNEIYLVNLSSPAGATIADGRGQVTLLNDDPRVGPRPGQPPADFNGDGHADLLWRHQASGELSAWFMTGTTRSGGAALEAVADLDWKVVATADFSGDAKTDIVWRHDTSGQLAVWVMNGTVRTAGVLLDGIPDIAWKVVGSGDFNLDGRADLLWRNDATGAVQAWLMRGTTVLGAEPLESAPPSDLQWRIAGTGDFNRDGHTDILWRHQGSTELVAWFMRGLERVDGGFLEPSSPADNQWQVTAVGDLDGDDAADILWRHQVAGELVTWLMDGNGLRCGASLNPAAFEDLGWQVVAPR